MSTDEDMEKREPFCTVGRYVKLVKSLQKIAYTCPRVASVVSDSLQTYGL